MDLEISLIVHDWGSIVGQYLVLNHQHEIRFNKLVLLDVADGANRDPQHRPKYFYQYTVLPRLRRSKIVIHLKHHELLKRIFFSKTFIFLG